MSSTPLEMSALEASGGRLNANAAEIEAPSLSLASHETERRGETGTEGRPVGVVDSSSQTTSTLDPSGPLNRVPTDRSLSAQLPPLANTVSRGATSADGSGTEDMSGPEQTGSGSTLMITLLLTTGARHPYKIDERYLKKRNIQAPNNDPFEISIYVLKELILREWRDGTGMGHGISALFFSPLFWF